MGNPKFRKKYGQHILSNPGIADAVIEKAGVRPTDTILEVGGGTGNLSIKLLQRCGRLVCYEKDVRLAAELVKRVSSLRLSHKFQLNVGDALQASFPPFDMCISNIPYNISSPLIFKLLESDFKCAYIMFQREFAQRLVARPGESAYSRLSVSVQLLAKVQHVLKVTRNSFIPPPAVDSSIVRIEPRAPKPPIDLEEFNRFLKICFSRKNKTLPSVFKKSAMKNLHLANKHFSKAELESKTRTLLEKVGAKRASKMDIEDFLALILEFKKESIRF